MMSEMVESLARSIPSVSQTSKLHILAVVLELLSGSSVDLFPWVSCIQYKAVEQRAQLQRCPVSRLNKSGKL